MNKHRLTKRVLQALSMDWMATRAFLKLFHKMAHHSGPSVLLHSRLIWRYVTYAVEIISYISHDFINTYIMMPYRSHVCSVSQDIRLTVHKLITKVILTQQYRMHIGPVPSDYRLSMLTIFVQLHFVCKINTNLLRNAFIC
jgi:hypothetical protein